MNRRRNIRKSFAAILFAATMVLSAMAVMCTTASAATEEDIEDSINMGVAWLVDEQNPDGSWGSFYTVARTGFALVKLEDRSRELGFEPLDPDGPYYDNIIIGLEYLDNQKLTEILGPLDPADKNTNEKAIYFTDEWNSHHTYSTGIALMAIANSGMVTDDVQDMVDWFIKYQNPDGGWIYGPEPWGSDNSNTGYAALGLAYAKAYGADIEDVLPGLEIWADYIQNDVDGDTNDGGSGYVDPNGWVNILKTGNLIFEFGLVGDNADSQRVQDAVDYIVRHWNDPNDDPGWRPHHYQAMYCTMKGLELLQIDEIDGIDWFDEFSTEIVNTQNPDGSWPVDYWGDEMLSTVWALLTLEKVHPDLQIPVYFDVKPGSCPNPINPGKKGVTPVAILGTEDFDVMTIDPATVQLTLECMNEGVLPLLWDYEDVATPFDPIDDECCHDLNGDGYMDLTLKFDTPELVTTLGLKDHAGETIQLKVVGNLMEEFGGTPFMGEDCVWILDK
jgi:prenyltransferase/squalene oxidase-like repeat protein